MGSAILGQELSPHTSTTELAIDLHRRVHPHNIYHGPDPCGIQEMPPGILSSGKGIANYILFNLYSKFGWTYHPHLVAAGANFFGGRETILRQLPPRSGWLVGRCTYPIHGRQSLWFPLLSSTGLTAAGITSSFSFPCSAASVSSSAANPNASRSQTLLPDWRRGDSV